MRQDLVVAPLPDESTEPLLAPFRRRVDAKIQADLAEEERAAQVLRQQVMATLRREVSAARGQGVCARVWVFGSFAWGQPEASSDIGLLVKGDDRLLASRIAKAAKRDVHALRLEEAPATLTERVFAHGVPL